MTDEVVDPVPAEETSEPVEEQTEEVDSTEEDTPAGSEDEEPKEELDEEGGIPEDASETSKVRFSQLKKDYPDLLKKHPELRANYFKAEKYAEYFPTPEDAADAARKVEIFDNLDAEVSTGNFENLIAVVGQSNPKALEQVADTILPQLYKQNPQLYFRASKQAIAHALKAANARAEATKDENLKASVQNVAQFVFGDARVPSTPQQTAPDPEKEQLKAQLAQNYNRNVDEYNNSVWRDTYTTFTSEIRKGLDPKNEMNAAMREYAEEKVLEDINSRLATDRPFQAEIQSLWNRAAQSNFPEELKAKIRNAYLARARTLLPAIRQKRRAEALGISPKPANGKTNISSSSGVPRVSSSKLTVKDIREKKMSPMDIIMHGAK